jgi:hypothetical protein
MKTQASLLERAASAAIGISIMMTGVLFMLLGVTLLPIIGLLIGAPLVGMSLYFFKSHGEMLVREEKTVALAYTDPLLGEPA